MFCLAPKHAGALSFSPPPPPISPGDFLYVRCRVRPAPTWRRRAVAFPSPRSARRRYRSRAPGYHYRNILASVIIIIIIMENRKPSSSSSSTTSVRYMRTFLFLYLSSYSSVLVLRRWWGRFFELGPQVFKHSSKCPRTDRGTPATPACPRRFARTRSFANTFFFTSDAAARFPSRRYTRRRFIIVYRVSSLYVLNISKPIICRL